MNMRRYFINGLLILLPGVITVYVLIFSFATIDGILGTVVTKLIGRPIPGAGSILTILLILATGVLTTNVIGRTIFSWGEQIFRKIPILRHIYQGVEQVTKAFSGSSDLQKFRSVVLIQYPREGIYSLGFVTNDQVPEFDELLNAKSLTVFIPTTPNPTSGFCIIVPAKDCVPVNISVENAFRTIISAGIIGPSKKAGEDEETLTQPQQVLPFN